MDTRTLLEKVQMRTIFWNTEIELVMKLKPTVVLNESDIVSMKELSSGAGQTVGIHATDAQDAWKDWIEGYRATLELWREEQKTGLKNLLWDIHGLPISSGEIGNEESGALPRDEGTSEFKSAS